MNVHKEMQLILKFKYYIINNLFINNQAEWINFLYTNDCLKVEFRMFSIYWIQSMTDLTSLFDSLNVMMRTGYLTHLIQFVSYIRSQFNLSYFSIFDGLFYRALYVGRLMC